MSRMKHLLRKLHIGSGGAAAAGPESGNAAPGDHRHHHRVGPRRAPRPRPPPSPATPPAASVSSASTTPVSSSRGRSLEPSSSESRAEGERAGDGERGFTFFEEEYQVQLALAISVSDPDGREDPELAQMEAAKRMSLSCNEVTTRGIDEERKEDAFGEALSLRYWRCNTVNYDEKIGDGFYDVYGIASSFNLLGKIPSLMDLQAVSVLDSVECEVVSVNRTSDCHLQQLESRAVSIASGYKTPKLDPIRSGLVQKIADIVVEAMGGPVDDVNTMIKKWGRKSCELRTSLNTIVIPLGYIEFGLSRHRALLFKVLADCIDLPCRLMKGSYYTGTDDGAVVLIQVDDGSEFIIDLMGAPGALIPAEIPSCYLQNSSLELINKDVAQTVKELCLAFDKKVNCQFEKTIEAPTSLDPSLDVVRSSLGHDADESDAKTSAISREEFTRMHSPSNELQVDNCANQDHHKNVNDLSEYVVSAAKNPVFAQRLHAVLVESGASPPPDLFQNISSASDIKDLLSSGYYAEKIVERNLDFDSSTKSGDMPCGFLSHNADPSNMESIGSSPKTDAHCFQTNCTEIVEEIETEGSDHLKSCKTGNKDKFRLITNSESSVVSNSRLRNMLNDVADWEISWEDVQIGERIGLGSYGEVYRADWHGTEVAVKKFLDQDLSGDALEQFRCEVKIMLRLRHPNVVLFMGAVTRPPNLSILTEYLPRESLYKLLHRANVKLDEKRRLRMAMDVAKGMNYLHTSHPTIVHRDLKSPNLLVDKSWVVKVCDFGLSRLQHHTFLSSKSTAGTPEWMAPEVLRNEPSNEKCDVYSFGVILWELATLRMPWSGMNPMQVVGAVGFQNKRLEITKEVDPMAAEIIRNCWHSEPSCRPSFTQLMVRLRHLQHLVVDS